MRATILLAALVAISCGKREEPVAPLESEATPVVAIDEEPEPTPPQAAPDGPTTPPETAVPVIPEVFTWAESPAPEKTWPYAKVASAKAYFYNAADGYRPLLSSESPKYALDAELSEEQWKDAIAQVQSIQGTRILSKCFLPRHTIVLFDESKQVVGSIDVCFTCEDIKVKPEWKGKQKNAMKGQQLIPEIPKAFAAFEQTFTAVNFPVFHNEDERQKWLRTPAGRRLKVRRQ